MFAWFGIGFLWALFRAEIGIANILPVAMEGRDLVIDGVVSSIPVRTERKTRFLFDVLKVREIDTETDWDSIGWERGRRVRLNWHGKMLLLLSGERWRLTVRLKRPHGFRNPGGFDYEKWLFQEGIRATGYVRSGQENRKITEANAASLNRMRHRLAQAMGKALVDAAYGGIVQALTIGVRDGVREEQWTTLRATGTAHLMAISGLHVGLITTRTYALTLLEN